MKVYVVYYHNYDESENVGVFNSEYKAKQWIKENTHCEADVVNYEVQVWEVL